MTTIGANEDVVKMELKKGSKMKVVYNDGEKIYVKDLIFEESDGNFMIFKNETNDNIEIINKEKIIRMSLKEIL